MSRNRFDSSGILTPPRDGVIVKVWFLLFHFVWANTWWGHMTDRGFLRVDYLAVTVSRSPDGFRILHIIIFKLIIMVGRLPNA